MPAATLGSPKKTDVLSYQRPFREFLLMALLCFTDTGDPPSEREGVLSR